MRLIQGYIGIKGYMRLVRGYIVVYEAYIGICRGI